jgi:uncharacterized protein (DUF983 family)
VSEEPGKEFGADGAAAPLLPVILKARCPRCGKGPLFKGFLTIAPKCAVCGLDFAPIDTGDGPAVFVILIAGFLIVGAALVTEVLFAPPYWVHLVLWLPLTLIVSLGLLRPIKTALAALQYKHRAAVGRLWP